MAQVCGGTSYDFDAEKRHQVAMRILSQAADLWAEKGTAALRDEMLNAVILRVYSIRQPLGLHAEARSLVDWLQVVGPVEEEMAAFGERAAAERLKVATQLNSEIAYASGEWSLGDPENPPVAEALNAIEHILFTHRLIRRPPSGELPKTLRAK